MPVSARTGQIILVGDDEWAADRSPQIVDPRVITLPLSSLLLPR
jgi:hypothetical protein